MQVVSGADNYVHNLTASARQITVGQAGICGTEIRSRDQRDVFVANACRFHLFPSLSSGDNVNLVLARS